MQGLRTLLRLTQSNVIPLTSLLQPSNVFSSYYSSSSNSNSSNKSKNNNDNKNNVNASSNAKNNSSIDHSHITTTTPTTTTTTTAPTHPPKQFYFRKDLRRPKKIVDESQKQKRISFQSTLHSTTAVKASSGHKLFVCGVCDKVYQSRICYSVHLSQHKTGVSYQKIDYACPHCHFVGAVSTKDYHLNQHIGFELFCLICETKTPDGMFHSESHAKYVHKDVPHYLCHYCMTTYKTASEAQLHAYRNHPEILPAYCRDCGQGFLSGYLLGAHARHAHPEKVQKCTKCYFFGYSETEMIFHMHLAHGEALRQPQDSQNKQEKGKENELELTKKKKGDEQKKGGREVSER